MTVVRVPEALRKYEGLWVAIADGEVVASAVTPRALVRAVRALGPVGATAVARFVPPPSDVIVIGVG